MTAKFKSAVHLFLIQNDKILLLRRYNTGYEDGNYSVVAGHLNGGEKIVTAAIREAKEEVGIDIREGDVEIVQMMHRVSDDERIDFFVAVSTWSGEIVNNEPDKCDDLSWFPLDKLPENTIPYVRQAIKNYQQDIPFSNLGWEDTRP
jgi:8-oxo-dGTP pyrophosphatase MutT (NUDIX family)